MMLIRIFNILKDKKNPFVIFAGTGITTYFAFQVCVNICSNLGLIPTKGMTLPFISIQNKTVEMNIANDILMSILNVNSKELLKTKAFVRWLLAFGKRLMANGF